MKFKTAIIFTIIALACVMISFGGSPSLRSQAEQEQGRVAKDDADTAQTKIVDYEADRIYKARGDSAIRLVGNVIFHHNGAIIQCDSAYRYDEKRMDCFGKVIINQDSTYIYGDMATYDGNINLAHVYAPLIKLVHGDAVLYTYNLKYNTKSSIADYDGGGIMHQNSNFMESESGVYDGNLSSVKLLNQVEMRNETYLIRTDSASFNMNTEVVTFLAKTYIWDSERDFLMADRGGYDTKAHVYIFTQDAYAMTPDQEMWADSMEYHSNTKEAFMQRNIQILDTTQQVLAFGDWGYYNDSLKNAILTRTPSVMAYETEGDTAYMRADSIFLYTLKPGMSHYVPSDEEDVADSLVNNIGSTTNADSLTTTDSLGVRDHERLDSTSASGPRHRDSLSEGEIVDSLRSSSVFDSLTMDSTLISDSLSITSPITDSVINSQDDSLVAKKAGKKQRKAKHSKAAKLKDNATQGAITADNAATGVVATTIDPDKVIATADKVDKIALPSKNKKKKREKRSKDTESFLQDVMVSSADSLTLADSLALDTMLSGGKLVDSLTLDSLAIDSLRVDSLKRDSLSVVDSLATPKSEKDSMERVVRAYKNVKIFRSDFQAIADSVVGFSVDSVMNMYGRPILWTEQSQVTADQIDAYAKDEKLDWADFIGSPFITQEVDTSMYNQASGKEMRAFFLNNEMDYAELEGNVMNYYYMEDEDSLVVAFAVINCAMLTMYFENQEPAKMNWSGQPDWIIYPIEDIPATQPQRLEGYTWSPHLRPANKEEITTRTVRPSIRAVCMTYKKPEFRIEQRINSYKKQILESGIWQDRTDLPLVTADYFTNRVLDY